MLLAEWMLLALRLGVDAALAKPVESCSAFEFHQDDEEAPQEPEFSALERRFALERAARGERFSFTPYAPNYFLFASYSDSVQPAVLGDREPDDVEAKFQISFKTRIADGIFGRDNSLWFGYTQLSLWQLYDSNSHPFRETNYQPELIWAAPLDRSFLGARLRLVSLAINHQSNGQSEPFSRSWNRIVGGAVLERGRDVLLLRGWARIPESASQDDNPDIQRYIGVAEANWIHSFDDHRLSLALRSNLEPENPRGSAQLDWSFDLNDTLRAYVQVFSGYGETLIDYDHPQTRVGVGVMVADWF